MKPLPWAKLPNAVWIDQVLENVISNWFAWSLTSNIALTPGDKSRWEDTGRVQAAQQAETEIIRQGREVIRDAAIDRASEYICYIWSRFRDDNDSADSHVYFRIRCASVDAMLALVAWDDCAGLLESDVDSVKTLAQLGNAPALLLLPAVAALKISAESVS
jgi:hypothetical protein